MFQASAFQIDAFQISEALPPARTVGWMPEWDGFRHDPEDLERRLKAQRQSVFNPRWLDRFLAAEGKARKRVGEVRSAPHRAALEEAIEQIGARVGEAIDAGVWAPEQLIIELEAAAGAKRATASLKHAQRAIEMAQAFLLEERDDEEEILLLLDFE